MTDWTPDRVATAQRLWAEGHSAAKIARQIGGVSRCAVIGKIYRSLEKHKRRTTVRVSRREDLWSAAKIETFRTLYKRGALYRDIAKQLGVTRTAVVGKAYRMRLAGDTDFKARSIQVHLEKRAPRSPKRLTTKFFREAEPPATSLMLSLMELEASQCHFPHGDPKRPGFGYCGHPNMKGFAYCAAHVRIMYRPAESSREQPAYVTWDKPMAVAA